MKIKIKSPIAIAHLTEQALNKMGIGGYVSCGDGNGNIIMECDVTESVVIRMLQMGLSTEFHKVSNGLVGPPRVEKFSEG